MKKGDANQKRNFSDSQLHENNLTFSRMAKFHVKRTLFGEDQKSLVFRGNVLDGDVRQGMSLKIPITDKAVIDVQIDDVVELESHETQEKRTGRVARFLEEPEALDIVAALNVADEDVTVE